MGRTEAVRNYGSGVLRRGPGVAPVIHVDFSRRQRIDIVSLSGPSLVTSEPLLKIVSLVPETPDLIRFPKTDISEAERVGMEAQSKSYNPGETLAGAIESSLRPSRVNIEAKVATQVAVENRAKPKDVTQEQVKLVRHLKSGKGSRCLGDEPHLRRKCQGNVHRRSDDPPESTDKQETKDVRVSSGQHRILRRRSLRQNSHPNLGRRRSFRT